MPVATSGPLTPFKKKPHKKRTYRRHGGSLSKSEKDLIANTALAQPGGLSPLQVTGLAKVLKRSPALIQQAIIEARDQFVGSAGRYVEIHKQATEDALSNGDAKSLDVAVRGAQWALTNISAEGTRIVDKPNTEATGSKVMIGIRVGGIDTPAIGIKVENE